MSIGPFQILIIVLVLLVLFGRGRISAMMGDIGKGVKSFRKGLDDDGDTSANPGAQPAPRIDEQPAGETAEAKARDSSGTPG